MEKQHIPFRWMKWHDKWCITGKDDSGNQIVMVEKRDGTQSPIRIGMEIGRQYNQAIYSIISTKPDLRASPIPKQEDPNKASPKQLAWIKERCVCLATVRRFNSHTGNGIEAARGFLTMLNEEDISKRTASGIIDKINDLIFDDGTTDEDLKGNYIQK